MSSRLQQFCRDEIKKRLGDQTLKQIADEAQVNVFTLVRLSSSQPHETKASVLEKLYAYLTGRELSL